MNYTGGVTSNLCYHMKYYFIILLLTTTFPTVGQIPKSSAEERIAEILASGVDTLIFCKSEQREVIPNLGIDTCIEYETEIFIWRYKGANYLQKFAMCLDAQYQTKSITSSPIVIGSSKAFDILRSHYKDIEWEQIVPAVFKWSKDGVEVYEEIRSSHPLIFELKLYVSGNVLTRDFNYISMLDSVGKVKNLNYSFNYNTWLNKLKEQVDRESKIFESTKQIK